MSSPPFSCVVYRHKHFFKNKRTADPLPVYVLSSAFAVASLVAYSKYANPTFALASGAAAVGYYAGGYMLARGDDKLGHDITTLTSAGLTAMFLPKAYRAPEVFTTVMSALAGVSATTYMMKSFQARTGKPKFHRFTT